jgi:hypothetical protein
MSLPFQTSVFITFFIIASKNPRAHAMALPGFPAQLIHRPLQDIGGPLDLLPDVSLFRPKLICYRLLPALSPDLSRITIRPI